MTLSILDYPLNEKGGVHACKDGDNDRTSIRIGF
jgi:hypothetical protein